MTLLKDLELELELESGFRILLSFFFLWGPDVAVMSDPGDSNEDLAHYGEDQDPFFHKIALRSACPVDHPAVIRPQIACHHT